MHVPFDLLHNACNCGQSPYLDQQISNLRWSSAADGPLVFGTTLPRGIETIAAALAPFANRLHLARPDVRG